MRRVLPLSSWLYERLLALYPEDLRRDFGGEMAWAFADDIETAWCQRRTIGVILIWWCAVRELLTVALPGQVSNPCILAPALSFALAASTQSAELCLALHQATHVDPAMLSDQILLAVLLPGFLNACVAFIVTRFYARSSIIALQLE